MSRIPSVTSADVKIVSDGTRGGTHVFAVDPQSGKELELRVAFMVWTLDLSAATEADVLLVRPIIELAANGVTPPPPDTADLEEIDRIEKRLV